jgi:hypothetical protein
LEALLILFKYNNRFIFILFIVIFFYPSLFSQQAKPWPRRRFPSISADNTFWIGTPRGLYRYQFEEDAWAVFGSHNGLPSSDVQMLMWDGEWLWAATTAGVAAGDVKLNKWLAYDAGNGLPSNRVFAMAAEKDYVWVGTDRGAARYDKLIQEWERFTVQSGLPDSAVYDIAVDGELVYFATGRGLAEYDVRFEKWRTYGAENGIQSDTIRFLYPTADYLWLFTDRGPARFNKKLHTAVPYADQRLRYAAIRDLAVENEQMWLATESGLYIYDPANSVWREFPQKDNLPDPSVLALCFNSDSRWFLTEKGISVLETRNQSWRRFDRTHGLSSDRYDAAAAFLGRTFLVNERFIDHYRPQENRWYVYPIKDLGSGKSRSPWISLNKEQGSYIQLGEDVRFSLSGTRFRQQFNGSYEYGRADRAGTYSGRDFTRMDLKAQLQLPGDRTLNEFYDNTDPSDTLYGVKYRGNESDILQEAAWGDIRVEQGKNDLLPALGVFGTSARIEYGRKTERYKRSLLSGRGVSGERTSAQETEFFRGNLRSGGSTFADTAYIRHSIFHLSDPAGDGRIDPGSERIFLDDGDPATNTANTNLDAVICGVTGDFDRLNPVVDYRVDVQTGTVQFMAAVRPGAAIVATGNSLGTAFERVLKSAGLWENAAVNRYFVGSMEILPHSFRLDIADASGARHPLAEFGLDRNGDDRVDPEFINTRDGILTFPQKKPFPSAVYDSPKAASQYRMSVRFQSEIPSFTLRHSNLLRGSEILKVDGDLLTAGNDYVLDYTSGTLLILKEGIVAEDSEIEIRYEYYRYRNTKEKFQSAGIGFSPSDNATAELSAFGFDAEGSGGNTDFVRGLDFFGEFKASAAGSDLKFTPQAAANGAGSNRGKHVNVRTDVSNRRMRLFAQYEKIDPEYRTLFERKFQLGKLAEKSEVGGTFYPAGFMDVGGGWSRQSTQSGPYGSSAEEDWSGKILFNKPSFPAVSLSLRSQNLDTPEWISEKRTVKGDFEYRLPGPILRRLSFQSLHLSGVWRRSWEGLDSRGPSASVDSSRRILDNRYLRVDFSPADKIQIDAYYRENRNRSGDSFVRIAGDPYTQRQKLFFTATVDRFTGLNGYLLYQGESGLFQSLPFQTPGRLSLNRTLLATLRIYPGRWIKWMSPYTFELDLQPEFRGSMNNPVGDFSAMDRFWELPDAPGTSFVERNHAVLLRNEFRPSGGLTMYLDYERGSGISRNWGSVLNTTRNRIFGKTEYRPSMFTLMTIQYQHTRDGKTGYSDFVTDNPIFWLETRWSERLQTKCNVSLWRERRSIGRIEESMTNVSPLIGMTYRLDHAGYRLEIRNDVTAAFYQKRNPSFRYDMNTYSNTLSLDFFPASVLILKLRGTASYRDRLDSPDDFWTLAFEFRAMAQF